MILDPEACYRAVKTRDSRFDGRLFVGVHSTGIYCRPICPARSWSNPIAPVTAGAAIEVPLSVL